MKLIKFFVALLCCFGSLSACSNSKLEGEGQEFVTGLLEQQKAQWDAHKMVPRIDPRCGIKPQDVENVFQMYTEVVGPIKTVNSVARTTFRSSVGVGVPDYEGQYRVNLQCGKGDAYADITAVHRDGKWTIMALNVKSNAFKKVNETEQAAGQKYVDQLLREICNTWNLGILQENASPEFAEDLRQHPLLLKGLFLACEKGLGSLKSFSGSHFFNIEPRKNQLLLSYSAVEEFDKGHVQMDFVVFQRSDAWKIQGFKLSSKLH